MTGVKQSNRKTTISSHCYRTRQMNILQIARRKRTITAKKFDNNLTKLIVVNQKRTIQSVLKYHLAKHRNIQTHSS